MLTARMAAWRTDEARNMALSQWFCAWPILADTASYRRYHLQHHAHTQQPEDPDLVLSAPFPITRASYRGNSGAMSGPHRLTAAQGAVPQRPGDPSWPLSRRLARLRQKPARSWLRMPCCSPASRWRGCGGPIRCCGCCPLLTWFMVITRIRNIAEHAVVPDANDPFRNTRTTQAGWIERAFIAPYWVNYHLEHHLLFWCRATGCRPSTRC